MADCFVSVRVNDQGSLMVRGQVSCKESDTIVSIATWCTILCSSTPSDKQPKHFSRGTRNSEELPTRETGGWL